MSASPTTHRMVRIAVAAVLVLVSLAAQATPTIEHWTLKNGVRVYFVQSRGLPMINLNVAFDAGSARDPEGRHGLAMMANGMLNDGTGTLDADAIAATFEGLGAEYGASSDRDMAGVNLRSLTDRKLLDPALDLFARLIAAPAFPDESLQRERARALLGLRQAEQSPAAVANKAFFAQLYQRHPYAAPSEGDAAGLNAITRAELAAFHQRLYVGRNAVLAMIGDVSLGDARAIAERVLGALPAGEPALPLPAVIDAVPRAAQRVIAHASTQTHILVGEVGIRRNDPDYFPLFVGNYVLGGGGFESRLTKEIRSRRGLSYSVYSYFQPLREPGPFVLGLQTQNHQRHEALAITRRVLAEFTATGPTAGELVAAKKNLTGGFALRIDSNKKIVDYLTIIGFYQLPLNYLDEFIPRVEAVTAEQIRDAFRRRIHPEHMLTVIVGGAGR